MSFFSIALKNIQKRFSRYLLNFISTIFAVSIFNLFCCIYYNPFFEDYRFGSGKMSVLFKGVAIAVLGFASIFVIYSNRYFIKTRKKEIAIYSLLGMRKTKIAKLMFIETFMIGVLATACGILIGIGSARYFTAVLMRFMGVGTAIRFTVDIKATVVTWICFIVLFVINGVGAYRMIYRYQLIDLLSAGKQGEHMSDGSPLGALLSILLLIAAYSISAVMNVQTGGMALMLPSFTIILLVAAGTYLLFCNMVPMMISLLKRNKALYFRIANFISVSQISFRIKANAKMLSVVALLCATTITMISASYSLYRGLQDIVDFYAPYSYICKNITPKQHDEMLETIHRVGEVAVIQDDRIALIQAQMQDSAYLSSEGRYEREDESAVYLLSESLYLSIIDHTGTKKGPIGNITTDFKGNLQQDECYFIDCNPVADYCKGMVGSTMTIYMNGSSSHCQVKGVAIHKYLGMVDGYKQATIVVSDSKYEEYLKGAKANEIDVFYGLMFDDEMASEKTVDQLNKVMTPRFNDSQMPANISYISFYKGSFALYGAYVFIGIFIGALFLAAVGSVMYYKMIMEAQDERPRYDILRKTGMNEKEIKVSIIKQLGITYLLPLAVGVLHAIFALLTYNRTLNQLGQETPTLLNAVGVVVGYILLYGMFYLLSVWHYHKIVTSKV